MAGQKGSGHIIDKTCKQLINILNRDAKMQGLLRVSEIRVAKELSVAC